MKSQHVRISDKAAEIMKDKVLADKIVLAVSKGLPAVVEHNGKKYTITSVD